MNIQSTWLVTGGSGYIGQHVTLLLKKHGFKTINLDLKQSELFNNSFTFKNVQGDYGDIALVKKLMIGVDGIIHLGALKNSLESINNEYLYVRNNFLKSIALFNLAIESNVKKLIFASSAAVYGNSQQNPVQEDDCLAPNTPYGRLKMDFERYLINNASEDFLFTSLRLFNVAGIGIKGKFDYSNMGLISQIVRKAHSNERVSIYGNEFQTPDGTAMRDFVHVLDVADSFLNAIKKMDEGKKLSPIINIATGVGSTVLDVINSVSLVAGVPIRAVFEPPRQGDIGISVGDNTKARSELDWEPKHDLHSIVDSTWKSSF
jgi:UDP-glucose 4-epimerase